MAEKTITITMQQKRGVSSVLETKNPVLAAGEILFVSDLNKFKVGDGSTAYNDLPFLKVSPADIIGMLDNDGKIQTSFLPALAIGDTEIVATDAERFALTTAKVQKGDVVIVTGTNKTYRVIDADNLSSEDGYAQILTPDAPVQSVNGKTGAVTLGTDDISEGETNKYYTDARVESKVKTMASTDLTDTAHIMYDTDTYIFDGGAIVAD